ncbi:MAG: molybdate ABC transporter permease subunit [Candidatus Latescibacterota bacterium]|nr:molybdate ABC transporter permease subunit [Candidatus Latescibacterota bacterium]
MASSEWEVFRLSAQVGVCCVAFSLPFGILFGWVLARLEFPGKSLLDGICHLPLVLPPVVTGYALLTVFGRRGPIGSLLEGWFGISLAFDWKGAVLASAVVGFPLMLRSIRQGIEAVDPRLEGAARTLGASNLRAILAVTLRLTLPSIGIGCLLSFARSLGEFGATITFVSNIPGETQTLPLAIFSFLNQADGDGAATRLVLVSVILSFVTILVSNRLGSLLEKDL